MDTFDVFYVLKNILFVLELQLASSYKETFPFPSIDLFKEQLKFYGFLKKYCSRIEWLLQCRLLKNTPRMNNCWTCKDLFHQSMMPYWCNHSSDSIKPLNSSNRIYAHKFHPIYCFINKFRNIPFIIAMNYLSWSNVYISRTTQYTHMRMSNFLTYPKWKIIVSSRPSLKTFASSKGKKKLFKAIFIVTH